MTIWVLVIHLSAISGVLVLPKERPHGYQLKADCTARIPELTSRLSAMGLPPDKITCESLELKK